MVVFEVVYQSVVCEGFQSQCKVKKCSCKASFFSFFYIYYQCLSMFVPKVFYRLKSVESCLLLRTVVLRTIVDLLIFIYECTM